MVGFYIVRDDDDTGNPDNDLGLPCFPYEVPLAIQDRIFKDDGSLFYPAFEDEPVFDDYVTGEGASAPTGGGPTALAEFFGDVIVVNGKAWPKMDVEPRHYRFRILNGCDSRFLILQFFAAGKAGYIKDVDDSLEPLEFTVIGNDMGRGPEKTMTKYLIGSGARADIVVSFKGYEGKRIIMTNSGPDEPYKGPDGDTAGRRRRRLQDDGGANADGDGDAGSANEIFQKTNRVMAFDVVVERNAGIKDRFYHYRYSSMTEESENPEVVDAQVDEEDIGGNDDDRGNDRQLFSTTRTRRLGLFEGKDQYGRLQPLLGTIDPATDLHGNPVLWPESEGHVKAGLAGKQMVGTAAWHEPITENPGLGDTEEWEIWNLSAGKSAEVF